MTVPTTFRCVCRSIAVFGVLIASVACEGANDSPRTALVVPIDLSNNAEIKATFVCRIDGEFFVGLRYARKVHTFPALTQFSANYMIKQDGDIVQAGNTRPQANAPAIMAAGFYTVVLGRFDARKGVQYDISLKLGADLPKGLPKSATVDIFLNPSVPFSLLRGW